MSGVRLEGDPRSRGDGHKVRDSASARALRPLHSLVPRSGVGQVGSSRPRPVTQRVGVGMKPGVGHKGPEGVDVHLYSDRSSGRATSRRVDLKVPRVGTESLRWTQMSERLGTKSQGSGTKSEGRM